MTVRQRWFFAAAIVVGAFVIGVHLWHAPAGAPSANAPISEVSDQSLHRGGAKPTKKRDLKHAHALLATAVKDPPPPAKSESGSGMSAPRLPAACRAGARSVAALNTADLYRAIRSGAVAVDPGCAAFEEEILTQLGVKGDVASCTKLFAGKSEEEVVDGQAADKKLGECQKTFLFLRAAMIDQLYSDDDPASLPPAVLANKLLVHLGDAFTSPTERAKMLGVAAELVRKEPDLYAGYKAIAVLDLFETGADGKLNPENPAFARALQVCKEFGVDDPELDEAAFFSLSMSEKPDAFGDTARAMLEENPRSAVANYFLAADAFKAGNRDEAIRLLQLAQQDAPGDERIRDTLEKAKTEAPTAKIFSAKMSVSFDDETL